MVKYQKVSKYYVHDCDHIETRYIDLLWNISHVFKALSPSWPGYTSKASSNKVLQKSIVTMLPIINLHDTDKEALTLFCRSYQVSAENLML